MRTNLWVSLRLLVACFMESGWDPGEGRGTRPGQISCRVLVRALCVFSLSTLCCSCHPEPTAPRRIDLYQFAPFAYGGADHWWLATALCPIMFIFASLTLSMDRANRCSLIQLVTIGVTRTIAARVDFSRAATDLPSWPSLLCCVCSLAFHWFIYYKSDCSQIATTLMSRSMGWHRVHSWRTQTEATIENKLERKREVKYLDRVSASSRTLTSA